MELQKREKKRIREGGKSGMEDLIKSQKSGGERPRKCYKYIGDSPND